MSTLNYWLGKLQRLQLFGHGVQELRVRVRGEDYEIADARLIDGVVYITVKG